MSAPHVSSSEDVAARLSSLASWLTPFRAALAIAGVAVVYGVLTVRGHGVTYDSPALFYAGDRTLFWLGHRALKGALDLHGAEPAGFHSAFDRLPDPNDPLHYPVLPGFAAAVASRLFHDDLGLFNEIDGHHLGLVLLNAFGLFWFCIYACRLLGRGAGIAATVVLALFPTAVGHSFNNAKDWPCAMFYGAAMLAVGAGAVRARFIDFVAAGVFLGLALSCKMNAVFAIVSIILFTPAAYLLLYRRRRLTVGVVGGYLLAPYVAGALFFALWPWLYQGHIPDWWAHINDYVSFMVNYGVGARLTWTDYPLRCLVFMTPPLVLFAAALGLVGGGRGRREDKAILALLVIWLGLPLLRVAVPKSNYYDANRHFIEYVPALSALAGVGAKVAVEFVWKRVHSHDNGAWRWLRVGRRAERFVAAAIAVATITLIVPIAEYRPFESAYFNGFIGGLGGAQRAGLFATWAPHDTRANGTEGDYWFGSLRVALERIRRERLASVDDGPIGLCGPPAMLARANWAGEAKPTFIVDSPDTTLIYASPREFFCAWNQIRNLESERVVVERVERGGGLIYEVFGPKRPTRVDPISPSSLYTQPHWYDHPGMRSVN